MYFVLLKNTITKQGRDIMMNDIEKIVDLIRCSRFYCIYERREF